MPTRVRTIVPVLALAVLLTPALTAPAAAQGLTTPPPGGDQKASVSQWIGPVEVGLMRGHSAMGNYEQALVHARKALEQAPDDVNRRSLEVVIPRLEAGEDIN